MIYVCPASTGFGTSSIDWNTGAPVSSVTWRVTDVLFPALSVAVITIVFSPLASVSCLLNEPLLCTVTCSAEPELSFTVTVTGLDVASFVVPDTVRELWFVLRPSVGLDTFRVGATVSTVN